MTNLSMGRNELFDEIHELVTARLHGELTSDRLAYFDNLLATSAQARRLYVQYIYETLALPVLVSTEDDRSVLPSFDDHSLAHPGGSFVEVAQQYPQDASFGLGTASGSVPAWPLTNSVLPSTWPVAYLVAIVVFGVGLLIGSYVPVSQSINVARTELPTSPVARQGAEFVGRITAMVDCRWSDLGMAAPGPVAVPLGRKYALASGLMEITYDTGAKVILQGPCTYEVDSRAGGYLSVGKLTARVESHRTTVESRVADHSRLSTLNSQLFSVRTPTATVTDLGTEFGVVVEDGRCTEVHCFRGLIEVQRHNTAGGMSGETIRLAATEGIEFGSEAAPAQRMVAVPARFTPISSRDKSGLIARYPFDEITGGPTLSTPDSSGQHRSASLQHMTRANLMPGRIGKALAFNIEGGQPDQYATVRWSPPLDLAGQSFTIAFWLNRHAEGREPHELILHKEIGELGETGGYAILRDRQSGRIMFRARTASNDEITVGGESSGDDAPQGVWVHCAVVGEFNPADNSYRISMYRNGVRIAERQGVRISPTYRPLFIGAAYGGDGWGFRGMLDDLQIYSRALDETQVKFVFEHPRELPSNLDAHSERR